MIEPERDDSPKLNRTELPETVVLTRSRSRSVYHAPAGDGGPACNAGKDTNYSEHDRVGLAGHYSPCRVCFNRAAVADEMLADDG